jgi:hypothetical protein
MSALDAARILARKKGFQLLVRGAKFHLLDRHSGLLVLNAGSRLEFSLEEAAAYMAPLPDRPIDEAHPARNSRPI